jgi:hypothetical protein
MSKLVSAALIAASTFRGHTAIAGLTSQASHPAQPVFGTAYFTEHIATKIRLAHHTRFVVGVLASVGLVLVLGFLVRRLRGAR